MLIITEIGKEKKCCLLENMCLVLSLYYCYILGVDNIQIWWGFQKKEFKIFSWDT